MNSYKKLVDDFLIPKCSGKAFILKKGQVMRVIEIDGGQVADIRFFNKENYKEQFAAVFSMMLNAMSGVQPAYKRIETLYSKVPWQRPMLRVIDDPVKHHTMGGHCCRMTFELKGENTDDRTCEDNFRECLEPWGISLEDVDSGGVFNAFMPRPVDLEGNVSWAESPAKDGDYIDFLAEMDVLVAYSNCPSQPPVNPEGNRDMQVQIFEN
ncbi:MAG: urea carboxylase-associated family protein [Rhodospirillaceae bacterium]|jgi:uncharacterized protein|nr:urea carboxylase-associated family protein [Rhodospirillaceae bacterium]